MIGSSLILFFSGFCRSLLLVTSSCCFLGLFSFAGTSESEDELELSLLLSFDFLLSFILSFSDLLDL